MMGYSTFSGCTSKASSRDSSPSAACDSSTSSKRSTRLKRTREFTDEEEIKKKKKRVWKRDERQRGTEDEIRKMNQIIKRQKRVRDRVAKCRAQKKQDRERVVTVPFSWYRKAQASMKICGSIKEYLNTSLGNKPLPPASINQLEIKRNFVYILFLLGVHGDHGGP
jgi:hypothetical protein